eukprot:14548167-Ditylum_brightwellii.AAC.1
MEIILHDWRFGHLHLKVKWSSGNTTWKMLKDMREDYPRMTARYIVRNKVSRSGKCGGDWVLQWAKKVERDLEWAVHRKTFSTKPVYKYGIQVPWNVKQAMELDEANDNTIWQDAIDKEATTLHMVFDVKQSLDWKCRMAAGGHQVNMLDIQVYSSTVNSISIQLLHVISHKAGLRQLCGGIGNAFPNAYTQEKVCVQKAGPEFGKYEGLLIIIVKALIDVSIGKTLPKKDTPMPDGDPPEEDRDPILEGGVDALKKDYTEVFKDFYPDPVKELDAKLSLPLIDEMEVTVFVNSDHAHNKDPCVLYEKMPRGVKVLKVSLIVGDNMGVIQNCIIADSLLKKKHVAIAFHNTREAAAAGIVYPVKTRSTHNFADFCTKPTAMSISNFLEQKACRSFGFHGGEHQVVSAPVSGGNTLHEILLRLVKRQAGVTAKMLASQKKLRESEKELIMQWNGIEEDQWPDEVPYVFQKMGEEGKTKPIVRSTL